MPRRGPQRSPPRSNGTAVRPVTQGLRGRPAPAALAVAEQPRHPRGNAIQADLLLLGIEGNLVIVLLYLLTRTVGIPLFWPHAGEVEG